MREFFSNFYLFDYDDREPQFYFGVPFVGNFAFTNLSFIFWIDCFLLFSLQSVINLSLALFVHIVIVQPLREGRVKHAFLIGYGVLIPALLYGPFYVLDLLGFNNVTFMLTLVGAVPNLLLLRVVEAMHGMLPSFTEESIGNFALYYSATLHVAIDKKTGRPERFTKQIFWLKLRRFLSLFLQTSLLYSILLPFDYSIAPKRDVNNIIDLFYWGNLINAFLMASLTSLVLDGKSVSANSNDIPASCVFVSIHHDLYF